jgi:hypothetical protein
VCANPSEGVRVEKLRRFSTSRILSKVERMSFMRRKVRAGATSAGLKDKVQEGILSHFREISKGGGIDG